jgi:hypothetical protein
LEQSLRRKRDAVFQIHSLLRKGGAKEKRKELEEVWRKGFLGRQKVMQSFTATNLRILLESPERGLE